MPNAIINVGSTGGQINISTATAPATPAVGVVTLYAGTDKALHALNSDGTDITIAAAAAASPITVQQTNSLVSTAIGATATAASSVVIGATACANQNNSVVIGNRSCSLLGGYGSNNCFAAVVIGDRVCSLGNGNNATYANVAVGSNLRIGASPINPDIVYGNTLTTCNNNRGGNTLLGIDGFVCNSYNSVSVGFSNQTCSTGNSVVIGWVSKACGGDTDGGQVVIGSLSCSTALCSQTFGYRSCSTHLNSTVIGACLSSTRTNTTHVNSLVAFGQAASLTNSVGSTGGSVTLNWDNSNIQTLTLTSNITTLTKSNPIDGAVYTLFLTQGGSGGYTVDFGADVDWAGGTGPTLSTAIGATDAVSLVYIAGITGYYGNANLNFS